VFTETWVGKPHIWKLKADWELQDYYCIIDDLHEYDSNIRLPSGAEANAAAPAGSAK
jgi:hypothetical protein